jgi:hypothetical protein
MRCNPLHRLFLVSLFFLAANAFPLRLYARRSASELMSGSSTNSIRCMQATDCAAAGYGIPANAHYSCNSQGVCTFGELFSRLYIFCLSLADVLTDCNSNYTLFSEACWLNGTVSKTCDCDPSRPSTLSSIQLPTSTVAALGGGSNNESDDDVEQVEETITVTETRLSIITKSSASAQVTSPPRPTSTRPPKYVTVTQLSISIVPYLPPIISQTRTKTKTKTQTLTETQLVTITSISISTASLPSRTSKKVSQSKKTQAPSASASPKGDRCSKTPDCSQSIPSNAHRICLKQLCKWSQSFSFLSPLCSAC